MVSVKQKVALQLSTLLPTGNQDTERAMNIALFFCV